MLPTPRVAVPPPPASLCLPRLHVVVAAVKPCHNVVPMLVQHIRAVPALEQRCANVSLWTGDALFFIVAAAADKRMRDLHQQHDGLSARAPAVKMTLMTL